MLTTLLSPAGVRSAPRSIARPLAGLAAAGALLIALTGCTGSPVTSTPPKSPGASTGSPVTDAEFSAARDAYDLELARCIRGKGLEVADPKPGEGIQESSPEIIEAGVACMDEIGDPPRIAGGYKRDKAAVARELTEVKCFRKLGFEVEEPSLDLSYTVPEKATPEQVSQCISALGR